MWRAPHGKPTRARRPFAITHSLAGDKRLTQEAIIALADRIPAANVEMNNSDLPTLFPNDDVPVLDRRPGELVERIIELRRWMALSYLDSDPEMKALTIDTLGDDLSISFSLVFHTPWLERGARVHAANHDLRRFGLKPGPYGSSALADHAKSGAVKVWRGLKSLTRS